MGDDGYMGIHYIILEFYVSNIIDLTSKSQKANKLIVTSVENEPANTKVGAGGPEEAVVLSGHSGWWPGGGQGVEWGEVYRFKRG